MWACDQRLLFFLASHAVAVTLRRRHISGHKVHAAHILHARPLVQTHTHTHRLRNYLQKVYKHTCPRICFPSHHFSLIPLSTFCHLSGRERRTDKERERKREKERERERERESDREPQRDSWPACGLFGPIQENVESPLISNLSPFLLSVSTPSLVQPISLFVWLKVTRSPPCFLRAEELRLWDLPSSCNYSVNRADLKQQQPDMGPHVSAFTWSYTTGHWTHYMMKIQGHHFRSVRMLHLRKLTFECHSQLNFKDQRVGNAANPTSNPRAPAFWRVGNVTQKFKQP